MTFWNTLLKSDVGKAKIEENFVASDNGSINLGYNKKLTVNGTGSVIKVISEQDNASVSIDLADISTTATSGAVATATGDRSTIVLRKCALKSGGAKMFATANGGRVSILGGIFSHDPSGEGITLESKSYGMEVVEGGVIVGTSDDVLDSLDMMELKRRSVKI